MTVVKLFVVAFAVYLVGFAMSAEETGKKTELRVVVDLADGSHIIGVTGVKTVAVQTTYAKMDIPLVQVSRITTRKEGGTALLELRNGDQLKGTLNLDSIGLQTLFGKIEISVATVRTVRVAEGSLPQEGLVLHYSFDTDEGGRVTDCSGMKNDGKVHGATWTSNGKVGGAFSFDGKDDFISAADSESLDLTVGFTVMAWIKANARADGDGWDGIVVKGDASDRNYAIGRSAGTKAISWYMTGGQGVWTLTSTGDVNDGNWHLLATTWDGSKATLYLDAVDDVNYRDRGNYGWNKAVKLVPNNKPLLIGKIDDGYPFSYFNDGLIDEVMIWNRALSKDEIDDIYRSQR